MVSSIANINIEYFHSVQLPKLYIPIALFSQFTAPGGFICYPITPNISLGYTYFLSVALGSF